MNEIWKDIKGYEGLYQVSNLGRVKSLDRMVKVYGKRKMKIDEKILKPAIKRDGYCTVTLLNQGKRKYSRIHRLVAQQFIKNDYNKPEVNHKNGIKTDNRLENLEWMTTQENQNHSIYVLGKRGRLGYRKNK